MSKRGKLLKPQFVNVTESQWESMTPEQQEGSKHGTHGLLVCTPLDSAVHDRFLGCCLVRRALAGSRASSRTRQHPLTLSEKLIRFPSRAVFNTVRLIRDNPTASQLYRFNFRIRPRLTGNRNSRFPFSGSADSDQGLAMSRKSDMYAAYLRFEGGGRSQRGQHATARHGRNALVPRRTDQ